MFDQEPFSSTGLQYAVPVTLESFVRGFLIHSFWAPQFWRSRMKAFRESNYTILDRQNSKRRIAHRLPEEIIIAIQQHVIVDSLEDGRQAFANCEKRPLKAAEPVFENLDQLSHQGRFMKVGYVNDLEHSWIKRYIMEAFGLALIPGLSGHSEQLNLTHIFLCVPRRPGVQIESGHWNPNLHLHPFLDKGKYGNSTTSKIVLTPLRHGWSTDWRTINIIDSKYVAEHISEEPSNLACAIREMELDLVAHSSLQGCL